MNREKCIQILLNANWVDTACINIGKTEWEELRQQFWLSILELPKKSFDKIGETENDLKFYSVRIIMNLASYTNPRKDSLKNIISQKNIEATENIAKYEVIEDPYDVELDILTEKKKDLKNAITNKLPLYERVIYQLHENGKSCRQISRETTIHRLEINNVINRIKTTIRDAATNI